VPHTIHYTQKAAHKNQKGVSVAYPIRDIAPLAACVIGTYSATVPLSLTLSLSSSFIPVTLS